MAITSAAKPGAKVATETGLNAAQKATLGTLQWIKRGGKMVAVAGTVTVGAVVADKFVFNDKGKEWLAEQGIDLPEIGGYLTELAGDAARKANKEFAIAAAGAVDGVYETIYAHAANFGKLLYNMGFKTIGKGLANWGRTNSVRHEDDPFVPSKDGRLVPASELNETATTPAVSVPAVGTPVTGLFNEQAFKTEFSGHVAETDLFTRVSRGYRIPSGALPPTAAAVATNKTIQMLPMDELIDTLEKSTANQKILDGLSAIEGNSELTAAFDEVRQAQGIEGISAMFGKLATGDAATPAAAAKVALGLTPG